MILFAKFTKTCVTFCPCEQSVWQHCIHSDTESIRRLVDLRTPCYLSSQ